MSDTTLPRSLHGKTLFITGASRGIGLAIAKRAAADGANIVIAGQDHRDQPQAARHHLQRGRRDRGRRRQGAAAGRSTSATRTSVLAAVAKAVETFGGIDILVNNASAISLTGTETTPMKRFDLMHGVNARGTYLCTMACLPELNKSAAGRAQPAGADDVAAAVDAAPTGSRTTRPTAWPSTA